MLFPNGMIIPPHPSPIPLEDKLHTGGHTEENHRQTLEAMMVVTTDNLAANLHVNLLQHLRHENLVTPDVLAADLDQFSSMPVLLRSIIDYLTANPKVPNT